MTVTRYNYLCILIKFVCKAVLSQKTQTSNYMFEVGFVTFYICFQLAPSHCTISLCPASVLFQKWALVPSFLILTIGAVSVSLLMFVLGLSSILHCSV